jgi:hypothetical protein
MMGTLFTGILRNAYVQTYFARIAAIHLSKKLDTEVKIEKLRISAFLSVSAKGIQINDIQHNPLILIKSLNISADFFNSFGSELKIRNILLDSAQVFIKRYKGDVDLNIINLIDKLKNTNSIDSASNRTFSMNVNALELIDCRFVYQIEENLRNLDFGMDYMDLDFQSINASFKQIHLLNDSISTTIKHFSFLEKSGFQLNNLESDFIIFNKGLRLTNANLETPLSSLSFNLNFDYDKWSAFNRFNDEVGISGSFLEGGINTADIAYFVFPMQGMDNLIQISGSFNGSIRNLKFRDLDLKYGENTSFAGNLQMTGLPNIYETFINLKVNDFSTSIIDFKQFHLPGGGIMDKLPETLLTFGKISVKGNFTGFYNDFVSNAQFSSNIGQLTTDIQFSNNPQRDIIEYRGDFRARKFDLGRFLKRRDYFGKLDFDVQLNGEGLKLEDLLANVKGKINTFQFKGTALEDIEINGTFRERQFTGDIAINDELIQAKFAGSVNLDTIVPSFNFNLGLANTHLDQLGLIPNDSSLVLASNIQFNFIGSTLDNIRGEIKMENTKLFYGKNQFLMKDLRIRTVSELNKNRTIKIFSDFVDGEMSGEFQLSDLKSNLVVFLSNYLPHLFSENEELTPKLSNTIRWDFKFKDVSPLLQMLYPQVNVSENSQWYGNFDAAKKLITSQINIKEAEYQGVLFDNVQLDINSDSKILRSKFNARSLIFKEESENDTLRLSIDNVSLIAEAAKDSLQFKLNWDNKSKIIKNTGSINGLVDLNRSPLINVRFSKADLVINDSIWKINPQNFLEFNKNEFSFKNLEFYSGQQQIEIVGKVDNSQEQILLLSFNNFNLSNFDILLNYKGVDIDGLIDGEMQFVNLTKNTEFLVNMNVDKLVVNKEKIGKAVINSKRNLDKSIFVNAEIIKIENGIIVQKPLILEGFYFPAGSNNNLDFLLYLNQLPVEVASPFLALWVDELGGYATGSVNISGNKNKPDFKGVINLKDVDFRIIYLNTKYKLNANAAIDNYSIDLQDVDLRDTFKNRAMVYGGLVHDHFRNFGVDLTILPKNFMGLNTTKGMNSLYYGKAFASGAVAIKGPFDAVELDITLESNRGSEMVIPINLTADVSEIEFINFVNHRIKEEEPIEKKQIRELATFSLNMDLVITPNAKIEIILPEDLGNIQGYGYGDLNLNLNRAGNFTMAGDYQVNKGSFLFTVKNVYKKRFDLVEGGTISWDGDPYAGELNMKAIYHVKTSLNTLGIMQDTSFRNRVPVNCVIGLKDAILNPSVKFGFEFPNSPEEVRQLVFSQIDTTNDAEMSQQMLSLLVLNSFSFASATGNDNFASSVGGSSLQLVANQLSNWLSQLNYGVDVGIKYRPGGTITNEEVEVALSTQLFDDRVTIDGNFGYQNLSGNPQSNTSNIVGDINVEVKLAKDGRFRLKAFNRTNTVDLFDNIAPFTQGVGVFYRKEFNFFKDLYRRKEKLIEELNDETELINEADTTKSQNPTQVPMILNKF